MSGMAKGGRSVYHCQPAHPGKVVTAKAGCGQTGNQAGISPLEEGFFHGLVSHN